VLHTPRSSRARAFIGFHGLALSV